MNQLKAIPLREDGKIRHMSASFVVKSSMSVVYTSMCSSGSVVSSYQSIDKPLHLAGSSMFMIPSTKGCLLSSKLDVSSV